MSTQIAAIVDAIIQGLEPSQAEAWRSRFERGMAHGADLSLVGWQFLHWLLTDPAINPGIDHPLVRDAVRQCAELLGSLAKGEPVRARTAKRAVTSAVSAVSAASAAWSASSAVWSAECAARSAEGDFLSAETALREAVRRAAASAARKDAYEQMADKLLGLIKAAPIGAP